MKSYNVIYKGKNKIYAAMVLTEKDILDAHVNIDFNREFTKDMIKRAIIHKLGFDTCFKYYIDKVNDNAFVDNCLRRGLNGRAILATNKLIANSTHPLKY